ncbi:MAG: prohibitin family protein [Hydrococcus sp. C42_A2020_068]|uniref:prohibitin family protein n=1 Tax=Pleurocapsa sp. PCC 7327 TaxID=118163 RepID=UPI00029F9625|nr:prohibitin family protein [Pleurocapsa sp. PCC 7327]AFY76996.1 membrane protease subunit, stomatin/prohibitin [Pleurocapsa sp. PCC 7327]MBF2022455.1 prohibitin family protein [Hydrococcus sp. C42_A2020_068]
MSLIISAITALIAFLVAFSAKDIAGEKNRQTFKAIAMLIGMLAVFIAIYQFISRFLVIIPAGKVGLVEVFGKVENRPLTSGIHFVNPLGKVIDFSSRLKDIKETVDTTSKEGLGFKLDVSLQYKIDPQKISEVYQNIGTDEQEIIISRFRSIIRQTTASYDAGDIYGEKREEVAQRLHKEVSNSLSPLGFIVEETLLRNVVLPEKIQAAIQQKLEAQQQSQQLDFELEKTRKEANRKRIEAQGIADSQKIISQGLSEQVLRLKSIEATQKLAESQNSKVIIIGGGEDKLPLILQQGQ